MATQGPASGLSPEHIMQVGFGFWGSKTLLSAVEIGLFTELAKGPLGLEELQSKLKLHARSARDFLDALVALGFLERRNGAYHNVPATDFFLDRNKASYIGGILEMANTRLYPFWNNLTAALRTGELQNEAKGGGESPFAALYAEPGRLKEFLKAMTSISTGANRLIAAKFPWSKYKTAADIGTAQGDLIAQVVLANPHISGAGFDLPEVKPIFLEYITAHGLHSRVSFQAGSFFDEPLPKADVLMMGHILHDWNLAEKKLLVRKAYETVPRGGALIVYESIIDDDRSKNVFGLLMSLNMLIETPGGFDYTGADCCGWMKEAGFRETRVEHLMGPDSMVVGLK
jgi:O-methyltransferase domain/Dimerisation domain